MLKKLTKKHIYYLSMLLFLVLALTGCVKYDANGAPTGWVYDYIGVPFIHFLQWLANIFNSYGVAIIIVTVLVRLLMLPSSIKMTKDSMMSSAKMKIAQPEIDEIQAEMDETTDPIEKQQLQAELMDVYKKYDISMMSGLAGCLPLLIQLPIISAVYVAIRTSEEILRSTFLGISLGQTNNIPLTVLVVIVYFVQGYMMQQTTPKVDNEQAQTTTSMMLWMNPIMLGYFSYVSPAGLALYFLVGGLVALAQQIYTNHVVRPKMNAMLEEETERLKQQPRAKRRAKKKVLEQANKDRLVPVKEELKSKRRNEGKQNK